MAPLLRLVPVTALVVSFAGSAHAAEPGGSEDNARRMARAGFDRTSADVREPPAPDRPAILATPRAEASAWSWGYRLETGIANTHLGHGSPKWDTKTTVGTEDLATFRLRNLGGGTFTGGAAFAVPFGRTRAARPISLEIHPLAVFLRDFGPVRTELGAQANFYPRRVGQVRGEVEGILKLSIPNKVLIPIIELYPEVVARGGLYASIGAEHRIRFTTWLNGFARLSSGAQGYVQRNEAPHAQDVTLSGQVRAELGEGFYVALRPMYATRLAPSRYYADPSFAGRSFAYANVSFGAER